MSAVSIHDAECCAENLLIGAINDENVSEDRLFRFETELTDLG